MIFFGNGLSELTWRLGDFVADHYKVYEPPRSLEENMLYAKEAMVHTLDALPLGASDVVDAKAQAWQIVLMRIDIKCRMSWVSAFGFRQIPEEESLDIISRTAQAHGVGNCGEHSFIAMSYLEKNKQLPIVERVSLLNNDHQFVVIGREPGSSITDIKTWGKSAVVCDPWGQRYFPASQLEYHINDILKTRSASPSYVSRLMRESSELAFDPRVESIGFVSGEYGASRQRVFNVLDSYYGKGESFKQILEDIPPSTSLSDTVAQYLIKKSANPVPPILTDQDRIKVSGQLQKYSLLQNRSDVHALFGKRAESLSELTFTAGIVSLLGRSVGKFRAPAGLIGFSLLASSRLLSNASESFSNHSTKYSDNARLPWK